MERLLENCAYSALSALNAQIGGADRVELCSGMAEGGTTPSYGEIVAARKVLTSARLHVIIRPRGGDFLYDDIELEAMLNDIKMAKSIGADGIVLGCLTADGSIDTANLKILLKAAEGMSTTFHRAFDVCNNPLEALETIINLGFDRILTSGQQPDAEHGIPLLRQLVERAADRIIIMPGCGINANNILRIALETGATEFHSSAKRIMASRMTYHNEAVSMGDKGTDEYTRTITDPDKIRQLKSIISNIKNL